MKNINQNEIAVLINKKGEHMMRWLFWILGGIAVGFILVFGILFYNDFNTVVESRNNADLTNEISKEDDDELTETKESIKLNPFNHNIQAEDLNDDIVQGYIHKMSHQKVRAEEKRGFYLNSPERVEWLLQALDVAAELEHEDLYRDILTRWKNGDFSKADKDHNAIWELQDGEVGKAHGLLTPEEEEIFIKSRRDGS